MSYFLVSFWISRRQHVRNVDCYCQIVLQTFWSVSVVCGNSLSASTSSSRVQQNVNIWGRLVGDSISLFICTFYIANKLIVSSYICQQFIFIFLMMSHLDLFTIFLLQFHFFFLLIHRLGLNKVERVLSLV